MQMGPDFRRIPAEGERVNGRSEVATAELRSAYYITFTKRR